ncbi:uncharacterized protein LOC127770141 [Oryza glaberrima]|uniref:uncharacterized protein LOC127770141 n=1 Tax=Oryza glaberrima TaxID=4538 RepID=UPI00224C08ED|nr:uncharacterized protein LOC127770141 [Oryza glaberrima]
MATGLGLCPFTGNILASPEWWTRMDQMRRGARAFRNGPLLFTPENHTVFRGRVCTLNRSGVPMSPRAISAAPQQAEILDIEDLTEQALQEPEEQTPRRGKRTLTGGTSSGSSSKRSRGSYASDALNRLANLRIQSNESRARRKELKQAKSARACMELLKADGVSSRDPIYHMALRVFRDGFLREFFLDDCPTPEGRLYFIQSQYQDMAQYQPLPPPGFGGYLQSAPPGTVVGEGSGYAAEAERAGAGDDEDGADDDGEGVGDNKGGQGGHGKGGDGDGDDGNGGAAGYGGSGYGGALYGGVPGSYDLSGYAMF